jgi:CrcB protein
MKEIVIIGMGGFAGAIARYVLGGAIHEWSGKSVFPWGTIIVNVLGCFCFGLIASLMTERQIIDPALHSMVFIGFLGAFTTFSTFSNDTIRLLDAKVHWLAWANMIVSVLAGFGALLLGKLVGKVL